MERQFLKWKKSVCGQAGFSVALFLLFIFCFKHQNLMCYIFDNLINVGYSFWNIISI